MFKLELDKYKTDVMFRIDTTKDFKGNIFAIMPHSVVTYSGLVCTYQHIGQHSGGDHNKMVQTSRPATKKEYKDLKKELRSLGYRVNVVIRRNYDKYLKDYYRVKNI